jgi:hypothetical protein
MRETCTSGSVGAPGSNPRGYPTAGALEVCRFRLPMPSAETDAEDVADADFR